MAQEPITIEFTLTEDDLRAAAAAERQGRTRKKRTVGVTVWYGIVLGLAIYLVIRNWTYLTNKLSDPQLWEQSWAWVVIGVVIIGALWWQRRTRMRSMLAGNARLRAPRTKQITRKAIVTTIAGRRDELPWRSVPRVVEGRDTYLVYRPNGMFDIIPKRVFETPEREQFEKLAGERLVRPAR